MPDEESRVDLAKLVQVSTATATHLLLKYGVRNTFLEGIRPLIAETSIVGMARTLRFLPLREDLSPASAPPAGNPQRRAVESIRRGDVLVIDAGGELGAGTIGDILATRIKYLGGAGLVVDGAVRDSAQIAKVGLPAWVRGVHAAASSRMFWPADMDLPIRCGGCTVMPGDYILADGDGVVVIPPRYAASVAEEGAETELREQFIRRKIADEGYSSTRAYPPDPKVQAEYEAWKKNLR